MMRSLLIRGMLAGLAAGLLGFVFAHTFGEGPVQTAIAFESYVEYDLHHEVPEAEMVSRTLQSSAGLGTGTLVYGVGLGGMFALVFGAAYGRLGHLTARGTAGVLGLLGFVGIYLGPFIKYPANPPSVGDPDTIQYRTATYLVLVVASVAAMVLAVRLRPSLVERLGGWNGTLVAAAIYIVLMGLCYLVFPPINEVPQQGLPNVIEAVTDAEVTFPPTVLWAFRTSSIGLQVVIWTSIALIFGALAERLLEPRQATATRRGRAGGLVSDPYKV
jgi:hypothetical protein